MTLPDALTVRRAREERRLSDDFDLGAAVLALGRCFDLSVEQIRSELHAVADAEDGHSELEDFAGTDGCGLRVNGLRAAGKNDRLGFQLADLRNGIVERMNDRE